MLSKMSLKSKNIMNILTACYESLTIKYNDNTNTKNNHKNSKNIFLIITKTGSVRKFTSHISYFI